MDLQTDVVAKTMWEECPAITLLHHNVSVSLCLEDA